MNILQVYALTADMSDEEVDLFYKKIFILLKIIRKKDIIIVIENFNAKIGRGKVDNIVDTFGRGDRNERGDTLVDSYLERKFAVLNMCSQLLFRRLYTLKLLLDKTSNVMRNQINYILVNKCFCNSITRVIAYPGANIDSDHNPVVANISLRLAKKRRIENK